MRKKVRTLNFILCNSEFSLKMLSLRDIPRIARIKFRIVRFFFIFLFHSGNGSPYVTLPCSFANYFSDASSCDTCSIKIV